MDDLIIPLWFILFAVGFPVVIGLWTRRNNTYGDAVRISGVATLVIGLLLVSVALPFMSFGESISVTTDARGEVVMTSENPRLWDGPTREAVVVTTVNFLMPLLLIGLTVTTLTSRYPRLSASLLWISAIWMLGSQQSMRSDASTFVVAVPIMAIVTAVFGTLAFRERKQREIRLRRSAPVPG